MQCKAFDAKLSIHFTTNAYLLTDNVLKQLEGLDVSFQITIDGGKQVHDSVRKTRGGEPTYARIVEHIHQTLSHGFPVGVRFNYTAKSIPSFVDVVKDFRICRKSKSSLLISLFSVCGRIMKAMPGK